MPSTSSPRSVCVLVPSWRRLRPPCRGLPSSALRPGLCWALQRRLKYRYEKMSKHGRQPPGSRRIKRQTTSQNCHATVCTNTFGYIPKNQNDNDKLPPSAKKDNKQTQTPKLHQKVKNLKTSYIPYSNYTSIYIILLPAHSYACTTSLHLGASARFSSLMSSKSLPLIDFTERSEASLRMPRRREMASAVCLLSPVVMKTLIPA